MADRTDPSAGAPIPILEQHRGRWDQLLIRRGLAAAARANAFPGLRGSVCTPGRDYGPPCAGSNGRRYRLVEAHRPVSRARRTLTPSPIVELNRAVAVAMLEGPGAGLDLVDALMTSRR